MSQITRGRSRSVGPATQSELAAESVDSDIAAQPMRRNRQCSTRNASRWSSIAHCLAARELPATISFGNNRTS